MFRTAVWRLTLWYLALVMLISFGFSVALYNTSTRDLHALEHRLTASPSNGILQLLGPDLNSLNKQRVQQIEYSIQQIKIGLLYFNFVILIGGGGLSYLLARRTLQPLETALEAQTRFTADASHELRTPLTTIKTELEVALRDRNLTLAESKQLHHSTLDEISKLEALAGGLLALTRQDTATAAKLESTQLDTIITDAVTRISHAASRRSITIDHQPSELTVYAERWSLTELLFILLDNAVKYSPPETTISIDAIRHQNGSTSVSVIDHGIGIAAHDLPHIFDRFYQADRSRSKTETSGYGLGLSIAQKLIERHHGTIEVRSTVGKGSTFRIQLPKNSPPNFQQRVH